MYLFDRGVYAGLSGNIDVFYPVFEKMSEADYVKFLWKVFKNQIRNLADMIVSSRIITSKFRRYKPWMNS